jgi:ATP-dependent Clp protease protease subunit
MLYNTVLPLLLSNMAIDKDPVLDNIPTLSDHGMMVLMGEIDAESVRPVVEWILYENYVKKKKLKELLLMICSEGGELSTAFALIDVMRTSKIPIKTVGLGQIASCGLLIFLSGAVGRRVLTANTSIMSHQFSWGTEGKAHELFATMKEFELTQQRMVNLYKSTTGLDEETIKTVLLPAQDVWLSASEALALGVCDDISVLNRN